MKNFTNNITKKIHKIIYGTVAFSIKMGNEMIKDYVVIDLEMTGLDAKKDKILETGAVRVRDHQVVETFGTICNPDVLLSEKVIELTGITQKMAEEGQALDEAVAEFLDFCGEDIIVGQNVIFDYSFLKQWAVNHKIPFERKALDTLKLARKFLPEGQKKNLEALCEYYNIERENAHRAIDDALATQQIFEMQQAQLEKENPDDFIPKPLLYKTKKQTPATGRQKKQIELFAKKQQITLETPVEKLTRSEASRLIDQFITQYGQAYREWAASLKK